MSRADLILRAKQLVTCAPGDKPRPGSRMNDAGVIEDGIVAIVDGRIAAVGTAKDLLPRWHGSVRQAGCIVPGLVDPHSHPLFAGSRVHEFQLRAKGASYEEIHAAGGGIASTVKATREASDADLRRLTLARISRMLNHGTTTLEVKSGYGLSTAEEVRHLKIYNEVQGMTPVELVPTFLGAHAFPPEGADYMAELHAMIPEVKGLAEFADVFCERGAFTLEQSREILEACKQAGFGLRIHAEEFSYQGGARMAAELGAVSADHLQFLPADDFPVLKRAGTIPVMTAGTSFFLGMEQFANARGMIEADLPVALGSDFNAGSCLSESLQMAMSLVVLKMKLTPEEALIAATVNSAHSLRRGDRIGSLEVGKQADLLCLDTEDYREWPYHYGVNLVREVYKNGHLVEVT